MSHYCRPDAISDVVTLSVSTPVPVMDIDANTYNTVGIGSQLWMAENLKTTKYRNGDLIGTTDPATLDIDAETTPEYQWAANGNESNVTVYGRLYTWYAANDSRDVCPTGWHVPSDEDWTTLATYLGGGDVAGGKLKETGTTHWVSPNLGATNETGFTALPGGIRQDNIFIYFGDIAGFWWSSTTATEITTPPYAYYRSMGYSNSGLTKNAGTKHYGLSVRCIKD
ncbi:MAG: hypothetical protein A2Y71_08580 [Bacteroidetes bacterium RBG_13_42_15]|nr:MAG: hypothetical protein A2Y71_08580 [Bacteroidetes bacterium RBG_13_42_15]